MITFTGRSRSRSITTTRVQVSSSSIVIHFSGRSTDRPASIPSSQVQIRMEFPMRNQIQIVHEHIHVLTSTVSSHSSIVIHFSPWTHHSHLILFTPDPDPDPTSIPQPFYVHGLISVFYSDSLFTMDAIPDPRSQIPRTTNSTASSYVHGLISFFYSDSLFTVDAPFTPHPVHTRSQIPDPKAAESSISGDPFWACIVSSQWHLRY